MEKSLTLFLNFLLLSILGFSQPTSSSNDKIDCLNESARDSLMKKYYDDGALKVKYGYNDPQWQLYLDTILSFCPNFAYIYQQKGMPNIKNGDYEKAFRFDDKAVELDPKRYTAYRAFLKCIFTKDYEGAIIDFETAQQLSPNNYEMDHTYPFYIGLCYLELGDYLKSKTYFDQDIAIQTGGDTTKSIHFNTLFYLGVLNYEMKNYLQAKKNLLECIKMYPQFPDANYYLALLYEKEKNDELKLQYLKTAKDFIERGFNISEDNVFYANYPHQISIYEIEQKLKE